MKKIRYFCYALLIFVLAAAFSVAVYADGTLSLSQAEARVGDEVSVTVTVRADDIGGYSVTLTYNTGVLEFVGAGSLSDNAAISSKAESGVIKLVQHYNSDDAGMTELIAEIKFKAIAAGTASIDASFLNNQGVVDQQGDDIVTAVSGGGRISVSPARTASADATLKSLTVSPGALVPDFDPDLTEYSLTVPASCANLAVSAFKNEEHASVKVIGTSLEFGSNTVLVRVTAENGATRVYKLTVNRLPETIETTEPDPNDTPAMPFVDYVNKDGEKETYEVTPIEEAKELPAGFVRSETTVNGKKASCGLNEESGAVILYVKDDFLGIDGFYLLKKNGTVRPFEELPTEHKFYFLDTEGLVPPENYTSKEYEIEDEKRSVFVPNTEKVNHVLVYAVNSEGETGLYIYDVKEKTLQKYGLIEGTEYTVETEPPETEPSRVPETVRPETPDLSDVTDEPKSSGSSTIGTILKIGIPLALVITVIVLIIVSRSNSSEKKGSFDYSDDGEYPGEGDYQEGEFDEEVYTDFDDIVSSSDDNAPPENNAVLQDIPAPAPRRTRGERSVSASPDYTGNDISFAPKANAAPAENGVKAAPEKDDGVEFDWDEYMKQINDMGDKKL